MSAEVLRVRAGPAPTAPPGFCLGEFTPSFCGSPHANPFRERKWGLERSATHPNIALVMMKNTLPPFSRDTQPNLPEPAERSFLSQHLRYRFWQTHPIESRDDEAQGPRPRQGQATAGAGIPLIVPVPSPTGELALTQVARRTLALPLVLRPP